MRSGFEKRAKRLFVKANINFEYETEKLPYTIQKNYIPDFIIGDIYVETKGYFRAADRTKLKAVKRDNPDIDLRIWFQQDNYLTKSKKKRYSDWAKQNGFPCHVGETFPEHWFK